MMAVVRPAVPETTTATVLLVLPAEVLKSSDVLPLSGSLGSVGGCSFTSGAARFVAVSVIGFESSGALP
jgi:hypothetical protein